VILAKVADSGIPGAGGECITAIVDGQGTGGRVGMVTDGEHQVPRAFVRYTESKLATVSARASVLRK